MRPLILSNGIYFQQSDLKETGYYIRDKYGQLIHEEYKPPSLWHKIKHLLLYAYPMNTNTTNTLFLYFDKYDQHDVYSDAYIGDAVSIAKQIKKDPYSASRHKCQIFENGIVLDLGTINLELESIESGRKLISHHFNKEKNEFFQKSVFTFLNWEDL